MKNSHNSSLKWKIRVILSYIASFLEISMAVLLAILLGVSVIQLIPELLKFNVSVKNIEVFHEYLQSLFMLVIGVEALKLLCKHTPESALSVLLFTIAREMIVSHTTPVENLLAVLSIGLIFAIRKFLFVPAWSVESEISSFERANNLFWNKKEKQSDQTMDSEEKK